MSTLFKDTVLYETYGETISVGDMLYKSTGTGNDTGRTAGRLYKLDVSNVDRDTFYGIAKEAGSSGNTNKKIVNSGKFDLLTGLTAGLPVWADTSTPGAYTQTEPTTHKQIIGIATSTTGISVNAALGASFGAGEGSGTGSLETIMQLTGTDVASWSTGKNAAFLGGGTISGTFAANTSSPLNGTEDYKYTNNTNSATSGFDYMASPAATVAPRFRGQEVTLFFPYLYDGANNDIRVVFWDATAGAEIPSSVYIQAATTSTVFKTNITIPSTCASIRVGFQTAVANNGKILYFDDVQLSSNTTIMASVANSMASVLTTGTTLASNDGIRAITVAATGSSTNYLEFFNIVDSATNGTRFYAKKAGLYVVSASTTVTTITNLLVTVSVNKAGAGEVVLSIGNNRYTTTTTLSAATSAEVYLDVGDYVVGYATSGGASYTNRMSVGAISTNTNILTAPDTFSTDTAPLVYASSSTYTLSTLSNAPVGTFITFTFAVNTVNSKTQTTTAPTQTTASMTANGIQLFARAYDEASTAALPAYVAIQVGKGLKGHSIDGYLSTGKTGTSIVLDTQTVGTSTMYGLFDRSYDETSGILTIDAATVLSSSFTTRTFLDETANAQASGYFVINASKNPALTGLNINAVAARGINTAGTSIANSGDVDIVYDSAKTYDTHGALNTSTGVFTAPETGYYQASWTVWFASSTYAAGNTVYSILKKGSTAYAEGSLYVAAVGTNSSASVGSAGIFLIKDETIKLAVSNNRTAGATLLNTTAGTVCFSVHKTNVG